MDMANESMQPVSRAPSQPAGSRRRRTCDERADELLKKQRRVVCERVGEILENDPEMALLQSEQEALAGELHVIRLNVTKKSQKVVRLSRLVSTAIEQLNEFHKNEKKLALKLAKNGEIRELKEQKVAMIVARGMGLAHRLNDRDSWDQIVNHSIRKDRFEIRPVLARAQNIGAEPGTYCRGPSWHRDNQFNEFWALI